MVLEMGLLYDFDLFPIFYTVSLLLTVIGLYFCIHLSKEYLNSQYGDKNFHAKPLPSITNQLEISHYIRQQKWLTRTVKRKEAPEDDVDFILNLMKCSIFKIKEDKCETTTKITYFNVPFTNCFNGVSGIK